MRFFFEKSKSIIKSGSAICPGCALRMASTDKGLRNDGICGNKCTHEWIDKNKTDGLKRYAGDDR